MAHKCRTTWWEGLFSPLKFRGSIRPGGDRVSRPPRTRAWPQQENADAACRDKINGACVNKAWICGLCAKDQLLASS